MDKNVRIVIFLVVFLTFLIITLCTLTVKTPRSGFYQTMKLQPSIEYTSVDERDLGFRIALNGRPWKQISDLYLPVTVSPVEGEAVNIEEVMVAW